jgi:WD40 repeat protein
VFLLDAFDGDMKQIYTHRKVSPLSFFLWCGCLGLMFVQNPQKLLFEASFSPDSRYVLSGGDDGSVHVWSAESGGELARLRGHAGPVRHVLWNPGYLSMASSCENLALWVPNV